MMLKRALVTVVWCVYARTMYCSEYDGWFGVIMVRYGDALARQPTVERSPIVYCIRLVVSSESGSGRLDVE